LSGLLSNSIFQKSVFCISQSLSPPNVTEAPFVFLQPPFLSSSTASIMKFSSCESTIAFINARIHVGHSNLHDPIMIN
jgi:hypothetical protein